MKNDFTSQGLAEAFAEHRGRLLSLVERRLNPILLRRLSHEDVMQEVYLAAAKRLPYFAQNRSLTSLTKSFVKNGSSKSVMADLAA